jgi:hypothetical protein
MRALAEGAGIAAALFVAGGLVAWGLWWLLLSPVEWLYRTASGRGARTPAEDTCVHEETGLQQCSEQPGSLPNLSRSSSSFSSATSSTSVSSLRGAVQRAGSRDRHCDEPSSAQSTSFNSRAGDPATQFTDWRRRPAGSPPEAPGTPKALPQAPTQPGKQANKGLPTRRQRPGSTLRVQPKRKQHSGGSRSGVWADLMRSGSSDSSQQEIDSGIAAAKLDVVEWATAPVDVQFCKRVDGSNWLIGEGAYGKASGRPPSPCCSMLPRVLRGAL